MIGSKYCEQFQNNHYNNELIIIYGMPMETETDQSYICFLYYEFLVDNVIGRLRLSIMISDCA